MEIYTRILKEAPGAKEGILNELALAVALEHSVPIAQRNAVDTNAPAHVDPVKRFQHFAQAHTTGSSTRLPNSPGPLGGDGRSPTRFRLGAPDAGQLPAGPHHDQDYGWRYVRMVATDVKYGSGDVQRPRRTAVLPEHPRTAASAPPRLLRPLHPPCLRHSDHRPPESRPRRAAPTPKGWVVNLTPVGVGDDQRGLQQDRNFLATTQARFNPEAYVGVKRAMWIGDDGRAPRLR